MTVAVEPAVRRRHSALWIAAAVGLVLVVLIAVLATRKPALDRQAQSPLLGHPAPTSLRGAALAGGTVGIGDFRGRWVLVNFVASWCVPCRQEHPELVKLTQRHQVAGDATVLGVIFEDSAANVRRFFADLGGDWPVIDDPGGRIALDYGVRGPPESFLVDPNGVVVSKIVGRVTADGIDRLLDRAKAAGA